MSIECLSKVIGGSIKGINQHWNVDAFSTYDLTTLKVKLSVLMVIICAPDLTQINYCIKLYGR